ncbi:DHHC palmitoyltransferase [Carpediemonas membranifera]|uniref:Palmitoyltransferase n=1 Tax=Carpediemonas membranifera TaxID=201153 RepID=A0A8J6BAZ9_9EUKA|nr:DHHC palmitoyltransferase [Carpediemonas membranifera]|eukprot:KAG9393597.1 DHHC palmitoyltransferase [Carpediemonas membranifera]
MPCFPNPSMLVAPLDQAIMSLVSIIPRRMKTIQVSILSLIERPSPVLPIAFVVMLVASAIFTHASLMQEWRTRSVGWHNERIIQPPRIKASTNDLQSSATPRFHPIFRYVIWSGYTVTLILFAYLCISDPGYITPESVPAELARFNPDYVTCFPAVCPTCNLPKPARARHCRQCNRCVYGYDHHCNWINNDVGQYNLPGFIVWLAVVSLGAGILTILHSTAAIAAIAQAETLDAVVFLLHGHMVFAVGLLAHAFVTVAFGLFFLNHSILALVNQTSSERARRTRAMRHALKCSDGYVTIPVEAIPVDQRSSHGLDDKVAGYVQVPGMVGYDIFQTNPYSVGVFNILACIRNLRVRVAMREFVRRNLFMRVRLDCGGSE